MRKCKLDKKVNKLNHILNSALDETCPMSKAKSIDPNNQWWTPHLKDMRNKVIKHYELYKDDKKNQRLEQD